tara:strand:+ start:340 stop:678 length:339 start_codon:yes stop_codon:yes gene_type:complete
MIKKRENWSLSKKLKKENKINDEFEAILSHLPLEDVIALKVELASKACGGKFYGNYLLKATKYIADEAIVKYALAACKTRKSAARFLGINVQHLRAIIRVYHIDDQRKLDEE